MCRENKVFFHTDGAQAVGKVPVDVNASNIDLMSISAHKIYGPKGVGAIYVRRRPRVRLEAQMSGGGQVLFLGTPAGSHMLTELSGPQQAVPGALKLAQWPLGRVRALVPGCTPVALQGSRHSLQACPDM